MNSLSALSRVVCAAGILALVAGCQLHIHLWGRYEVNPETGCVPASQPGVDGDKSVSEIMKENLP